MLAFPQPMLLDRIDPGGSRYVALKAEQDAHIDPFSYFSLPRGTVDRTDPFRSPAPARRPLGRARVLVSLGGVGGVRAWQHALYWAAEADPERRFHALRDKVFRRDVLWRAWVAVRRNDGAPGIDKTTLDQVEQYGVTRLLDELASELGTAGIGRCRRGGCGQPGSADE